LLPLLHVATARAHVQAGELGRATAVLEDGHAHPAGNPVADEVRNRGLAAYVAASSGELERALDLARAARASADELGLGDHEPGRIHAELALVVVHVERHEHEAAGALMDAVRARTESSRRLTLESLVTLEHARLARTTGDEETADAALSRARLQFADPDEAFRRVLDEEGAAQALRFAPGRAAALIAGLDPVHVTTTVLRARLALVHGDDRAAAALLVDVPPPASRRALVEREVLQALSVLERDVERANEHLRAALLAGQRDWLVSTVIEHGLPAHKLLASYTPTTAEERYVAALLDAVGRTVAPVRSPVAQPLLDPLSQRELTVLRYLSSRLTYVEIAAALFVSPNTLKSHVRTVYRKLAVASRADAVAAGRHLALI
jgi:LuxR family maltose regulon positive regulatory protein